MDLATFGAGCFWHVEEEFRKQVGVISTRTGYSGGNINNPTYEQVCRGDTNHAESVQVEYNPKLTSYKKLLEVFWRIHDPTTLNRQGLDVGSQYRSVIFYHNSEQKRIAEQSKEERQKNLTQKISTSIEAIKVFYPAEERHQKYIQKKRGS